MKRTWTAIGESCGVHRNVVEEVIDELKWQDLPVESAPFMPAEAVKEAIRELKIPARRVALNGGIGSMGLYGIEGHYKNGRARIYFLDEGASTTVLCSDLYEPGELIPGEEV